MRALQTQPTVSPTLIHHIQRKHIIIKPNIKVRYWVIFLKKKIISFQSIDKNTVEFENGEKDEFDSIILCTGYKIDLNYLSDDLQNQVFLDENKTSLNVTKLTNLNIFVFVIINFKLFKQVFHPRIGKSLAFLGFIQPSSGGLITVSEMQARWHTSLILNQSRLPIESEMKKIIESDTVKLSKIN